MKGFIATLQRELASLWFTPRAWSLLVALLILQGLTFSSIVASFAEGAQRAFEGRVLDAFYGQSALVPLAYILLCPALTMRSLAEERRSGTIDNLLSAPVSTFDIVLGKYMATLVTFVLLWLPSVAYPMILSQVTDIDWRTIIATYAGISAVGAGALAIGTLFSALTRSQSLAMALTVASLVILFLAGVVEPVLDDGVLRQLCNYIAIQPQLAETSQGIISLSRVVYDATLITFPLFLATRLVASWRWS